MRMLFSTKRPTLLLQTVHAKKSLLNRLRSLRKSTRDGLSGTLLYRPMSVSQKDTAAARLQGFIVVRWKEKRGAIKSRKKSV